MEPERESGGEWGGAERGGEGGGGGGRGSRGVWERGGRIGARLR